MRQKTTLVFNNVYLQHREFYQREIWRREINKIDVKWERKLALNATNLEGELLLIYERGASSRPSLCCSLEECQRGLEIIMRDGVWFA
jgi:hypothetical protein